MITTITRLLTYKEQISFIVNVTCVAIQYGLRQAKTCLRACAKCANSHNPARAQGLIRAFALQSYIL